MLTSGDFYRAERGVRDLCFPVTPRMTVPLNCHSMKSEGKKVSFATNQLNSEGAAQPDEQARLIQYDVVNQCS